jgi:rhodanese-related sulfurtransferase
VAGELIAKGFKAEVLKGGWREWSAAIYPVEKK